MVVGVTINPLLWPERALQAPPYRRESKGTIWRKLPLREAPPCLPRPDGVGGELHSSFLEVSVDQFS